MIKREETNALLLPACFREMSLVHLPVGEFLIKQGLAGGLLAGDRHHPCLGYLDFNSFSQKAMDQWLHQGEGDDLSTADFGWMHSHRKRGI